MAAEINKRRLKQIILRSLGVLCLLAASALAFYWFIWLEPLRKEVFFPRNGGSEKEYWKLTQQNIRRYGWRHDDGFHVGRWGDKSWLTKIMTQMKHDDLAGCAGHIELVLPYLANQTVQLKDWPTWWEKNKSKSQEDWIWDGFKKEGIELQKPLSRENIIALLVIVGTASSGTNEFESALRFNAIRWLRDSDFKPLTLKTSDIQGSEQDKILTGLIQYSQQIAKTPKNQAAQVLSLGEPAETAGPLLPMIFLPRVVRIVYLGIAGLFVLGIACLISQRRLPAG